tara:strand:+ start:2399 stop:2845 length:447 start_codon:yes stop_codon:yes gene_type:complete
MKIGYAIYDILSNDASVTGLVSTRIYPNVAKQTSAFPFLVYRTISVDPTDTKGGEIKGGTPDPSDGQSPLDTNTFEVLCFSETYSEAVNLAVKVRAALDRNTGTYVGVKVQGLSYLSSTEYFDIKGEGEGIYVQELSFNLRQQDPMNQ